MHEIADRKFQRLRGSSRGGRSETLDALRPRKIPRGPELQRRPIRWRSATWGPTRSRRRRRESGSLQSECAGRFRNSFSPFYFGPNVSLLFVFGDEKNPQHIALRIPDRWQWHDSPQTLTVNGMPRSQDLNAARIP